jgi:phage/plasmid-associated DNA primase
LADIIEECTRVDKDFNTPHSELFKAYQHWSEEMGIKFPLSSKLLAKRLRERGWRDMRTAASKCVWRGIAV